MSFMNLPKYYYFNDRELGQNNFRGPGQEVVVNVATARLAAVPASRIQPLFHDINRVFCSPTPIASAVRGSQQRHLGQTMGYFARHFPARCENSSIRGCDWVRARLFTRACVCACMCVYVWVCVWCGAYNSSKNWYKKFIISISNLNCCFLQNVKLYTICTQFYIL